MSLTPYHAAELVRQIEELWPRWRPTDPERSGWMRFLGRQRAHDETRRAIEAAWESSRYANPRPADISAAIFKGRQRDRSGKPSADITQAPGGGTGWYVQAAEPCPCGVLVGTFHEILFSNDSIRDRAIHRIADHAEATRNRCQELYGGRWVVVQEATQPQMAVRRSGLRNPAPPQPP